MEDIFITENSEQTKILGEKLAARFKNGGIIALYGELGSGKTTFVQGLARGLGIKRRIISPTFVLVRQYKVSPPRSPFGHLGGGEATTSTPARCSTFYHTDLYRIESQKDIKGLGIEEIINNPQNVVAIEWAEKIRNLLPKKRIEISFKYISDNKRKIIINE